MLKITFLYPRSGQNVLCRENEVRAGLELSADLERVSGETS